MIPADYNEFSKNEDIDLQTFDEQLKILSEQVSYLPENGTKVGEHEGAHFYTIGQRQGLGIGGLKEPPFVIDTDVDKNIVYIGEGKQHPGLYRKGLFIKSQELHWVRPDLKILPGNSIKILSRIRYRQALQKATLHMKETGAYLIFNEDQRGITSGQFAAFYIDDELIGSGVIF